MDAFIIYRNNKHNNKAGSVFHVFVWPIRSSKNISILAPIIFTKQA
ncbi:hypothetical protein CLU97_3681 [Chryseobacterium sp. 7]|nr:hypothetical protein CLU97_3681 [Chryseobacterium sp. 7]